MSKEQTLKQQLPPDYITSIEASTYDTITVLEFKDDDNEVTSFTTLGEQQLSCLIKQLQNAKRRVRRVIKKLEAES